jgi:acyl-[acyl-carrier-protein]-phospholipid O-acyltransferase/long-chain-fatty-acid--[acyl-carrier-protein] ligase
MEAKQHRMSSFGWLNVTQFLGALNDNVFKLLVIFFLKSQLGHDLNTTQSIAMVVFVIPFLLFSHAAGVLADRFSKRHIVVAAKVAELVIMAAGFVALKIGNPILLYLLLFMMCTQSAFFGPSKYGIIPELVGEHRLCKANSFLVGLSYLAIIIGTFLPSFFVDVLFKGNYLALAGFCVGLATLGVVVSRRIEVTPAVGSRRRFTPWFVVDIFKTLTGLKKDRYLQLALLGSGYFLFVAAFIQMSLFYYGEAVLGFTVERSGYLFPVAALGIGVGALLAGKLSGRNVEIGVIPLGAIGLSLCCIAMGLIPETVVAVLIVVLLTGVSAGLYVVPLNAFIQQRAPRECRGQILACSNFLSFLGAAISAAAFIGLTRGLSLTPQVCFVVAGVLTALLATITLKFLPDFFVRLGVVTITRLFYRIRVGGLDNLPVTGAALLIPNHVTWVDALLLSATQQRRIRFMMLRSIYETRWIKPLWKLMGVIPVSPTDSPRRIIESLNAARAAIDEGYMVCIFAEGALTRNGNMRAFRPGFERIVKNTSCPIIPVHIGGAWGSIFSHYHGKLLSSFPRKIPYPVSILFGKPLPATVSPLEVRNAVCELSCDAVKLKKRRGRSLNVRFIRRARRYWFRHAISDTSGKSLTFGRTLIGSIALASLLKKQTQNQEMVGIVMPACVGGALANVAVTLMGKVPVNLNFTASSAAMASAIKQCNIETIITSRSVVEKLSSFEPPEGSVFIEDIMQRLSTRTRLTSMIKALCLTPRALAGGRRLAPDDVATIIFSSGSTGEPKGVLLSHHNLISNLESIQLAFGFEPQDRICAVLPFFHSFGLTATLWTPLICGFSAYYHPNPLDGAVIGELVRENRLTAMVATPTFLLSYVRRAGNDDFRSLRTVMTGAEKLKPRIADAFQKKFGIRPIEGYGATELSPVGAMNVPDVDMDGAARQTGTKEGSVGHPVPGVAARIVDPDTLEVLPEGKEGLLQIKGPNVMLGDLDRPDETAEVLQEGWYSTGDVARIDSDGFIFLVDRLSRYSKIGGEMVPHLAVEEALIDRLNIMDPCIVVTSAPDARKGEQLVVCYTPTAGDVSKLQDVIKASDLPNLWKPKKENYAPIDDIPTLGSGKVDLKEIKNIARAFVETRPGAVQRAVSKLQESL